MYTLFGYGDGGYLQACVSVNGRRLNVHVHRCVAETFLPNECGYEIVNHMDGCKQHNDVWNLEWCTRKENYFHAVDMGANRLRCAISGSGIFHILELIQGAAMGWRS